MAILVGSTGEQPGSGAIAAFFALWTIYIFVSGIVAVPYNDIVARSIASERRSRMLAIRFFGGGLLALAVASIASWLLEVLSFSLGYAAVLAIGAVLLLASTLSFLSAGEPEAPASLDRHTGFVAYLRSGIEVLKTDQRFRFFLYAQWLGGTVTMALPFYILRATAAPNTIWVG